MPFLTEEEKQLLWDRYLDIEWCDDVTQQRCVVCQRVAIFHRMSNCKHIFCKKCSDFYRDSEQQWRCSQCHEYVTQLDDDDFDVEVKIHQLKISCPNKKYGCNYADQLRKMPSHSMTCVDTKERALPVESPATNPNENVNNDCGKRMTELKNKVEERINDLDRKCDDMDRKFNVLTEMISAVDNKVEERNADLESVSTKRIDGFQSIIPLLHSMNQRIQDNELLLHQIVKQTSSNGEEMRIKIDSMSQDVYDLHDKFLKSLTETTTEAEKTVEDIELVIKEHTKEFQSISSRLESVDQRVEQIELLHQQTMNQMVLDMEEMKTKTVSMAQEIETLQLKTSEILNPLKAETYEWTIKDVEINTLEPSWTFETEKFTFTRNKYDVKAKLENEGFEIKIQLQFKDSKIINEFLNKYAFTTVKYIIRDQSDKHKDITREIYLKFHHSSVDNDWIFVCADLPKNILSPPYVNNDCIKISIVFEPASIDLNYVSNNGVLMWKVDNYKLRKHKGMYSAAPIYSPTFYTSPQGYRVRIRLTTYGIAIFFLTGEHDNSLSIDFPHKTTVTLYNRTALSNNVVKSEQRPIADQYSIDLEFNRYAVVKGYVEDDSLLLKVVIEPVVCPTESTTAIEI